MLMGYQTLSYQNRDRFFLASEGQANGPGGAIAVPPAIESGGGLYGVHWASWIVGQPLARLGDTLQACQIAMLGRSLPGRTRALQT